MSQAQNETLNRRIDQIQKSVNNLNRSLSMIDPQIHTINNSLTQVFDHIKQQSSLAPSESISDPRLSQQIWELEKKLYEHCRYSCQDFELTSVRFDNLNKTLQGYNDMFLRFNKLQQEFKELEGVNEKYKQKYEQAIKENNDKIKTYSDEIYQLKMISDKFVQEQKYIDKLNRQIITSYATVDYVDKLQNNMKTQFESYLDTKINRMDFNSIIKSMENNLESFYHSKFDRIENDFTNKLDGLFKSIISRDEFDTLQKSFYMQKEDIKQILSTTERRMAQENKNMEEKLIKDIKHHQGNTDQQFETMSTQIKTQQDRYKLQELQIMSLMENVQKNLNHLAQQQRKSYQYNHNDSEQVKTIQQKKQIDSDQVKTTQTKKQINLENKSNKEVISPIQQNHEPLQHFQPIQFQIIQYTNEKKDISNLEVQNLIDQMKESCNENFFPMSKGLQISVSQNEQEDQISTLRQEQAQIQSDIYKYFKTNDKKLIDLEQSFTQCLEKQNTVFDNQIQIILNDLERKIELPDINKIFDKKQFQETLFDLKNQILVVMDVNYQQYLLNQQALRQQIREKQKKINKLGTHDQNKLKQLNEKINEKEFLLNNNEKFQQKLEIAGFKKSQKFLSEFSQSFIFKTSRDQQDFSQTKNILNINKSILPYFPEEIKNEIKSKFNTDRLRTSSECVRVKMMQKSQQVRTNHRVITSMENSPSGRLSPAININSTIRQKKIQKISMNHNPLQNTITQQ